MDTNDKVDPEFVLQNWRTKILNGFLVVAAGIAAIMTVATILDARSSPGLWPAVFVYIILNFLWRDGISLTVDDRVVDAVFELWAFIWHSRQALVVGIIFGEQ